MTPLPLATRESPLALAQARLVQRLLAQAHGVEDAEAAFPILAMTTTGDRLQDRTLMDAGGKGLFTKEIDEALLSGRAAIAVHSMKDVPTVLPDGLDLAAFLEREDPRDMLLTAHGAARLADLPQGAVLGTASLRRQAQALHLRPDLQVVTLRGNVDTRLGKLRSGEVAATFLACAGLKRLGRAEAGHPPLDPAEMLPAVAQGIIGLAIRSDDAEARAAVRPLDHLPSAIAATAERAFLKALDGSCRTPIAAHAVLEGREMTLRGEALTPDGAQRWTETVTVTLGPDTASEAHAAGFALGERVKAAGGAALAAALGRA
ncbi:MAG: hydroxymethylbilane synthase [Maricaulis sp.]|jgi:hydroxymethylbilane synthase|nr:hydroxymethylbilane synthase [Maricaulis sp.]HAQ36556.1 hydroxymethylbilane synthase [Alphaproteobacteria bacterium]